MSSSLDIPGSQMCVVLSSVMSTWQGIRSGTSRSSMYKNKHRIRAAWRADV